jgi:AcrR family transcriptional regulator
MPTTKRRTEVRQGEIAKAALELISAHGMKGLRVAAVARKVGIVPSGIYRHYRNKDGVLDAILDFIQHRFNTNVGAVLGMKGEVSARLHALLMKHIRLIQENESIPLVIFSAEVYTGNRRRRVKLLGIIESYLAKIAALVEQGQREGNIRADTKPAAAAMMFLGLIQPSVIVWHLSAGKFDVTKQAEAGWQMFWRAIRCQQPQRVNGKGVRKQ